MNAQEKRVLLPLLRRVQKGETPTFRMRSAAEFLIHRLQKRPKTEKEKAHAIRKAQDKLEQAKATIIIREAVFARAGLLCEVAMCASPPDQMDHWEGGSGRRRQKQSVQNCWALCNYHHNARTANYPDTATWNAVFRAHCEKHGYPFHPHVEKAIP